MQRPYMDKPPDITGEGRNEQAFFIHWLPICKGGQFPPAWTSQFDQRMQECQN